jgi:hypothetical protein
MWLDTSTGELSIYDFLTMGQAAFHCQPRSDIFGKAQVAYPNEARHPGCALAKYCHPSCEMWVTGGYKRSSVDHVPARTRLPRPWSITTLTRFITSNATAALTSR